MGLQTNEVEFTEPAGQGNATTNHQRICVVGPSTRFLSGISYYTIRQINEFVKEYSVSAILMRRLLPARFYPGRERVGVTVTGQKTSPRARVLDGVDWYWFPSLFRAIGFLLRERPAVIIFHWWTGTVLHSYLFLAVLARMLHAKVVIEFHEVLDPGEWLIPIAKRYVKLFAPWLMRIAQGFVIHSEFDRSNLDDMYGLENRPVAVIPLAPFDQYQLKADQAILREAPPNCLNILYFGLIRSYKGVEYLVAAFDLIPDSDIENYWLTIVGETWEGWTLPVEMIQASRYRNRITFVNRYVPDEEVAGFFSGADVVVLPYLRSSGSGPLQIAMSHGLLVILTDVGGLPEAVRNYPGKLITQPRSPEKLRDALHEASRLRGEKYVNPYSWEVARQRYGQLFDEIEKMSQT